jgi:hypothetical protein
MKCEACSEPGVVQVTDVRGGKQITRSFCKRHASEKQIPFFYAKKVDSQEWEAFITWLTSYVKQDGELPPATEIEQHATFWCRDTEKSIPDLVAILTYQLAHGGVAALEQFPIFREPTTGDATYACVRVHTA